MERHAANMTSDQPIPDNRVYRQLLIDVYCAFEMMPHLHGAIPSNIRDVRAEVNAALTSLACWSSCRS
jgi:hypothetical protein